MDELKWLLNTIYVATTQFGKSSAVLAREIAPLLEAMFCFLAVFDPKRTLGMKAAELALAIGIEPELIVVEDLTSLRFGLPVAVLTRSSSDDPLVRKAENRAALADLADTITLNSGIDINSTIMVKEWVLKLGGAWQATTFPQSYLPSTFRPGSKRFAEIKEATDDESRFWMQTLEDIKKRNPVEYYKIAGPLSRRIDDVFDDPAVAVRLEGEPYDLESLIERQGVFIMLGGEVETISKAAVTFLMRTVNQRLIRISKRHWARHATKLPMRTIIDEFQAYNLLGQPELDALSQTTGMGLTHVLICQNPDLGDEKPTDDLFQNCPMHVWGHCESQSVAARGARDLQTDYDPKKVKRQREHQRQIVVDWDPHEYTVTGKSKDSEGNEREDERKQIQWRPRHETVTDYEDEYYRPDELRTLREVDLMTTDVGWFWFKRKGRVAGPVYVPELEDPWVYPADPEWGIPSLGEEMYAEHVAWLRSSGIVRRVDCLPSQPALPAAAPKPSRKSAADRARDLARKKPSSGSSKSSP